AAAVLPDDTRGDDGGGQDRRRGVLAHLLAHLPAAVGPGPGDAGGLHLHGLVEQPPGAADLPQLHGEDDGDTGPDAAARAILLAVDPADGRRHRQRDPHPDRLLHGPEILRRGYRPGRSQGLSHDREDITRYGQDPGHRPRRPWLRETGPGY